MQTSPFELAAIESFPTRATWDGAAAELVATMLDRWSLVAQSAFVGGEAAAVLAVATPDGQGAVLKVGYPHHEAVAEALGLEAWSPLSAPRVLRQDAWSWALLLERIEPGGPLHASGLSMNERLSAAADLLSRLHSTPAPVGVPAIGATVGSWLSNARAVDLGAFEEDAVDLIRRRLDDGAALLETDGGRSLLHGDANPGNILWDESESAWKTIDPKPMTGDAEFDLHPLVEQVGGPLTSFDVLADRVAVFTSALSLDEDRALRWCAVRCAFSVVWASADGNRDAAGSALSQLRYWDALSEL